MGRFSGLTVVRWVRRIVFCIYKGAAEFETNDGGKWLEHLKYVVDGGLLG